MHRTVDVDALTVRDKRNTLFGNMDDFDRAVQGHGMSRDAAAVLKQSVRDQVGDVEKVTAHDLRQVVTNLGEAHKTLSGSMGSIVDKAFSGATQIYMNRTNDADVFRGLPTAKSVDVADVLSRGRSI